MIVRLPLSTFMTCYDHVRLREQSMQSIYWHIFIVARVCDIQNLFADFDKIIMNFRYSYIIEYSSYNYV